MTGRSNAAYQARETASSTRSSRERKALSVLSGVHRDATESFDISADLMELARTAVTLVCSGAKIIVDLGKTLEFLESQSVPVIGYGTAAGEVRIPCDVMVEGGSLFVASTDNGSVSSGHVSRIFCRSKVPEVTPINWIASSKPSEPAMV